jgi:hypothetical protein
MQYQTRRVWKKLVDTTWKTQRDFVEAVEANMERIGLLNSSGNGIADSEDTASERSPEDRSNHGVRAGKLNRGRRIDYMLQEKEIENANEYVAALAAHSSYWPEKDLSVFVARQINLSMLERATSEAEAAENASL